MGLRLRWDDIRAWGETSKGLWILRYWVPQLFRQVTAMFRKATKNVRNCFIFVLNFQHLLSNMSDLELAEAYKYLEVIVEDKPTPMPSTGRGRDFWGAEHPESTES